MMPRICWPTLLSILVVGWLTTASAFAQTLPTTPEQFRALAGREVFGVSEGGSWKLHGRIESDRIILLDFEALFPTGRTPFSCVWAFSAGIRVSASLALNASCNAVGTGGANRTVRGRFPLIELITTGTAGNASILLLDARFKPQFDAARKAAPALSTQEWVQQLRAAGGQVESNIASRPSAVPLAAASAVAPPVSLAVPAPVTGVAPRDRTDSELARMRQELDSLKAMLQASTQQSPAQVPPGKRLSARALVIGNADYGHFGRLANPRNDASAIAAKLKSFGMAVDLVLDPDRDGMIRALNEYAARAAGTDINVLFYAGHGVQVEGTNYLIPTNMRADGLSVGYIKLAAISLDAMLDYLPARTRIVFLDACRENPASRSLSVLRSGSAGLAPVSTASGTLIAYATRDGATAADGDGPHSPYTTALLRHIEEPQDIAIVLRLVRQTVMRATGNRQEPWEYGSIIGESLVLSRVAR